MRFVSYFLLLLIVVFGMTFAALNSESVTIDYYLAQHTLPLSLLLVIVFALGCLVGMGVSLWLLVKSKVSTYKLKQQLVSAEKEIKHLKTTST